MNAPQPAPVSDLTFAAYSRSIDERKSGVYPGCDTGSTLELAYLALGLAGEAGEAAEKVKKHIRDGAPLRAVVTELGDVLWYMDRLARVCGADLAAVAVLNMAKLDDRKARGVLHGAGDQR